MALPMNQIDNLLRNRGQVQFNRANIRDAYRSNLGLSKAGEGFENHIHGKTAIGTHGIVFTGVAKDSGDPGIDMVNIVYDAGWFTYGKTSTPGYVYSDSFSGCAFYLYRGKTPDDVWGVHASRQSKQLKDPTDFFIREGFHLLWKWDSLGALSDQELLQGHFSAVLCCVDHDRAYCYALSMNGTNVHGVIDEAVIDNWKAGGISPMAKKSLFKKIKSKLSGR